MGIGQVIQNILPGSGLPEGLQKEYLNGRKYIDDLVKQMEPSYKIYGNFGNSAGISIPGSELGVGGASTNLLIEKIANKQRFMLPLKGLGVSAGVGLNPISIAFSKREHDSGGTPIFPSPLRKDSKLKGLADFHYAIGIGLGVTISLPAGDTPQPNVDSNSASVVNFLFYEKLSDISLDLVLLSRNEFPTRWLAVGSTYGEGVEFELASGSVSAMLYACSYPYPESGMPTVTAASPYAPAVADRDKYEATVIVQPGMTLGGLCKTIYGVTSMQLVNEVAKANNIQNPNIIHVGQKIHFPKK